MSCADCFAAALAKIKNSELITGDPEFKDVEKQIKVVWLKEPACLFLSTWLIVHRPFHPSPVDYVSCRNVTKSFSRSLGL